MGGKNAAFQFKLSLLYILCVVLTCVYILRECGSFAAWWDEEQTRWRGATVMSSLHPDMPLPSSFLPPPNTKLPIHEVRSGASLGGSSKAKSPDEQKPLITAAGQDAARKVTTNDMNNRNTHDKRTTESKNGDQQQLLSDKTENQNQQQIEARNETSWAAANGRVDRNGSSHCFFRHFDKTVGEDRRSGMPIIGEVFVAPDQSAVYIAAEGRRRCQKKYHQAHNFFRTGKRRVQYLCQFYDASKPNDQGGGRVYPYQSLSDPVHPTTERNYASIFVLIRCPLPDSAFVRSLLPNRGAPSTRLHLTLKALRDVGTWEDFTEMSKPLPQVANLPVCSNEWPSEPAAGIKAESVLTPSVGKQQKKYKVALMTRVASSYIRGEDGEQMSVERIQLVPWIEYHLALGVDHLYIYDDSPNPQTSRIREWCQPYVTAGSVTYVHYPYVDLDVPCDRQPLKGSRLYSGQFVSTNAALRRFQRETEWMGHWDVDEYLTLLNRNITLSAFLDQHSSSGTDKDHDEISLSRPAYGDACESSQQQKSRIVAEQQQRLPFENQHCTRFENAPHKGLYRTSTVLNFAVHYGHYRLDNQRVSRTNVAVDEAYIAHFRKGKAAAGEGFSGRSHVFDAWVERVRTQMKKNMR